MMNWSNWFCRWNPNKSSISLKESTYPELNLIYNIGTPKIYPSSNCQTHRFSFIRCTAFFFYSSLTFYTALHCSPSFYSWLYPLSLDTLSPSSPRFKQLAIYLQDNTIYFPPLILRTGLLFLPFFSQLTESLLSSHSSTNLMMTIKYNLRQSS